MDGKFHIIPNSTPVPNLVIDKWLPILKDTELRIVLIVIRQTIGWIEDSESGRRKERDWISRGQLMGKSGRGHSATAAAVDSLVKQGLIEALNEAGDRLDTAEKRQKEGERIYYRFNTFSPPTTLFDTFPKSGKGGQRVHKSNKNSGLDGEKVGGVSTFQPGRKADTTKETDHTKINTIAAASLAAPEDQKMKGPSPHKQFIEFWHNSVQSTRGIKPVITGQDASNLKRVLDLGISEMTLEKIAIFFLADYSFKKFSPSISTFLSSGILNGLLNRTHNDPEFWKKLDGYISQHLRSRNPEIRSADPADTRSALQKLYEKYSLIGRMSPTTTP